MQLPPLKSNAIHWKEVLCRHFFSSVDFQESFGGPRNHYTANMIGSNEAEDIGKERRRKREAQYLISDIRLSVRSRFFAREKRETLILGNVE